MSPKTPKRFLSWPSGRGSRRRIAFTSECPDVSRRNAGGRTSSQCPCSDASAGSSHKRECNIIM
eukprot:8667261-Alexandrium_andersonii.AAC.1